MKALMVLFFSVYLYKIRKKWLEYYADSMALRAMLNIIYCEKLIYLLYIKTVTV